MKQKPLSFIALIFLFALPATTFAQTPVEPGFNPNKLIEDAVFSDIKTFGGPEGIQRFLETKNSILANKAPEFLAKLKEPSSLSLKQALEDPQPNLPRLRTAAELIWDVAQSSGLNPQVILVTLNKEQGLITARQTDSPEAVQKALDRAMGFGCPVATGCSDSFPGFYFQLFGNLDEAGNRYLGSAKSLMRSFNTPGGRGPAINGSISKIGDTITIDNSLGAYEGVQQLQSVTLTNSATAALYRYTPHVFNGNYNFWRFFNAWFKYPNGTLLRAPDGIVYIIQNGNRQQVPPFVAQARGLNLGGAISVSPNELESYPVDKVYGPADNTIISVDGKLYVFISNTKHPASAFVIGQRGLNPAAAITVSATDAAIFTDGPQLTPSEGTVLKGQGSPAVYLVEGGTLKLFTPFTFGQRNAIKTMQTIPDAEIASYPKQGFVMPLNGTLIKPQSSGAVYVIEGGAKRFLTAELFRNRGYSFKNIVTLSDDEVGAIPTGSVPTPKDNTYFKSGNDLYIYKSGAKHKISPFVAQQKKITPDFTFDPTTSAIWPDGSPIMPRDGTLIKGDKEGTVYVVTGGQLHALTLAEFQAKRYSFKNVVTVSQGEIDSYPKEGQNQ